MFKLIIEEYFAGSRLQLNSHCWCQQIRIFSLEQPVIPNMAFAQRQRSFANKDRFENIAEKPFLDSSRRAKLFNQ